MTYEEFQRIMRSIIERQKRFDEGMERMGRAHESGRNQLETTGVRLLSAVARLNKARTELKRAQKKLAVKMAELAEAQAHTDQRLNALLKQGCGGES